jgi:hypothetical protein
MSNTIHFYEIDGGPSGIWWEGRVDDDGPYIGMFDNQVDLMRIASILSLANHPIRFHTQAEYELDSMLEEILGG